LGEVIFFPAKRSKYDLFVRVTKNRRRWEVWLWETFQSGAAKGKNLGQFSDEAAARADAEKHAKLIGIRVEEG
jgi:hypothetical protein